MNNEVNEKLMTPKKFSIAIEKKVKEFDMTYLDALLDLSLIHI